MSWDDGLTGVAWDIAATDASPLRVIAGPGTGKSFALKRRVARLLEAGQDPRRVLAVTFTRNAARALVDDLTKLGVPGSAAVRVGTLHSFCFSMLNPQDVLTRLGRVPRPIVTFTTYACLRFEGAPLVADLMHAGAFGGAKASATRIRAFEAAWARLESETPGWPTEQTDRAFQQALVSWLRFHEAMLIGELVPEALSFLRNNPATPERHGFDHVLVDEYQDLNKAEQVLVDLLAEGGRTAVVGDPDQSIYSFRYANPEGIEDYAGTHPVTHDEVLDTCRRCPTGVVDVADSLIRHNHATDPHPRLLPLAGQHAGEIAIVQWQDIGRESAGIADAVQWYIHDRGYKPSDILVLTSRRLLGYQIRNNVRDAGIAVHSFYHEEPLESEPAQRAFCLLSLLANPDDRVSLRWWLGAGHATWRASEYARLRAACELSGQSPRSVLDDVVGGPLRIAGTRGLVDRYRELVTTLAGLQAMALADLVDILFPDGDEDCSVLREIALLGIEVYVTPGDLLDRLRTHITQPEMPEDGDFVRVMSLHKSKGLTNKVVIVSGCIEGLIPVHNDDAPTAVQDATMQEQRRLFYVAITRCTEVLVISSALQMERALAMKTGATLQSGGGHAARTIASRFVYELGPTAPTPITGPAWVAARSTR
jgi:DNA helicase II / ATP-dependent DNA helicase PcrA